MKWEVEIASVGSEVVDILEDTNKIDLVVEGRRNDMKDYEILFHGDLPQMPLSENDVVVLSGQELKIIALSGDVNEYIGEHAACTIDISGNRKSAKEACTLVVKPRDPRRQFLKTLQKYV